MQSAAYWKLEKPELAVVYLRCVHFSLHSNAQPCEWMLVCNVPPPPRFRFRFLFPPVAWMVLVKICANHCPNLGCSTLPPRLYRNRPRTCLTKCVGYWRPSLLVVAPGLQNIILKRGGRTEKRRRVSRGTVKSRGVVKYTWDLIQHPRGEGLPESGVLLWAHTCTWCARFLWAPDWTLNRFF